MLRPLTRPLVRPTITYPIIRDILKRDRLLPSLDLNFARDAALDPRVTFTRPSEATYYDEMGVLQTAQPNEPRFDYDPATGECRGLLVEGQATNLLLWSKDFTNSAWAKGNITLRDSGIPSVIEGTTWTELEAHTDGNRYVVQNVTGVEGTVSTFTYFRKSETEIYGFIFITGGIVRLNLKSGLATVTEGSVDRFAVEEVNDSFKLIVTKTYEEVTNISLQIGLRGALAGQKMLFAGAQLEQGTHPTSYIHTEGIQVTRAADSISMPVGDWYRPDQGTLIVDCVPLGHQINGFVARLHKRSNEYIAAPYVLPSGVARSAYMRNGGASISALAPGGILPYGDRIISAVAWDGGEFVGSTNGTVSDVATQPDGPPHATKLQLATSYDGKAGSPTAIRSVTYYPRRLTDAQLIALTS